MNDDDKRAQRDANRVTTLVIVLVVVAFFGGLAKAIQMLGESFGVL